MILDEDCIIVLEDGICWTTQYKGFMLASMDDEHDDPIRLNDGLNSLEYADIQGKVRWILRNVL